MHNSDAGTVLRNTQWVVGMVIYCGQETKVQMNSRCDADWVAEAVCNDDVNMTTTMMTTIAITMMITITATAITITTITTLT